MTAQNLVKAIEKMGGTATVEDGAVTGELNGYDIEMLGNDSRFYTIRRINKRGYYDLGSDYNPGGYTFCNRIKDLGWTLR